MSKKNIIILVITIIIVAVIAFVAYYLFVDPNMFNPDVRMPKEILTHYDYHILKMSGLSKSRISSPKFDIDPVEDTQYYIIMTKENKVAESIIKETFASEEIAKKIFEESDTIETFYYNKRLDGKSVICNFSFWNGYTEDKVRDSIKNVSNPVYEVI